MIIESQDQIVKQSIIAHSIAGSNDLGFTYSFESMLFPPDLEKPFDTLLLSEDNTFHSILFHLESWQDELLLTHLR